MHLDLACLKSVRDFSEAFLKTEPKLDLLINNAGDLQQPCMFWERPGDPHTN